MRINLAKVVPFLVLVGIFLLWALAQNSGTDESPDDGYDYGYDTPDTGRADSYFDAVAIELAEPGVYVDPSVTEISAADAARLDATGRRHGGAGPGARRTSRRPARDRPERSGRSVRQRHRLRR